MKTILPWLLLTVFVLHLGSLVSAQEESGGDTSVSAEQASAAEKAMEENLRKAPRIKLYVTDEHKRISELFISAWTKLADSLVTERRNVVAGIQKESEGVRNQMLKAGKPDQVELIEKEMLFLRSRLGEWPADDSFKGASSDWQARSEKKLAAWESSANKRFQELKSKYASALEGLLKVALNDGDKSAAEVLRYHISLNRGGVNVAAASLNQSGTHSGDEIKAVTISRTSKPHPPQKIVEGVSVEPYFELTDLPITPGQLPIFAGINGRPDNYFDGAWLSPPSRNAGRWKMKLCDILGSSISGSCILYQNPALIVDPTKIARYFLAPDGAARFPAVHVSKAICLIGGLTGHFGPNGHVRLYVEKDHWKLDFTSTSLCRVVILIVPTTTAFEVTTMDIPSSGMSDSIMGLNDGFCAFSEVRSGKDGKWNDLRLSATPGEGWVVGAAASDQPASGKISIFRFR